MARPYHRAPGIQRKGNPANDPHFHYRWEKDHPRMINHHANQGDDFYQSGIFIARTFSLLQRGFHGYPPSFFCLSFILDFHNSDKSVSQSSRMIGSWQGSILTVPPGAPTAANSTAGQTILGLIGFLPFPAASVFRCAFPHYLV